MFLSGIIIGPVVAKIGVLILSISFSLPCKSSKHYHVKCEVKLSVDINIRISFPSMVPHNYRIMVEYCKHCINYLISYEKRKTGVF